MVLAAVLTASFGGLAFAADRSPTTRDPLKWPFAQDSIWNMPIGSEAVYVPAGIKPAQKLGVSIDEDVIILTPDAPPMKVFRTDNTWGRHLTPEMRYVKANDKPLFSLPIPPGYVTNFHGLRANHAAAVLQSDGRSLHQSAPFQACPGGYATTHYVGVPKVDLYGDGILGAHGGSGLSSIGGTLRLSELNRNAGPIRHVLKVNVFSRENLYYDEETRGFRWPAVRADRIARAGGYQGQVKACRMGSLLALPPSIDVDQWGLQTEPARRIARALQDFGAYIVDDTAWSVYAFATEEGPAGNFNEEFEKEWGYPFAQRDRAHPWSQDIHKIFAHLHVIDNNGPQSIGGGGTPRQPLAPLFEPGAAAERQQRREVEQ